VKYKLNFIVASSWLSILFVSMIHGPENISLNYIDYSNLYKTAKEPF